MTETNAPNSPPASPAPKKPKKPHRWRRRFLWSATILILLGIVIRIVLPLSLPMVLRKVAGIYGMTCSYDRLELNLVSGDAGIWGLRFTPKEGGPPILTTDYCDGNLSVPDLFRGRLDVWRVEADGVDVNVDRNADGHIPLLDRFIAASNSGAKAPVSLAPATGRAKTKPGEIDLSSPLRVDALRLTHIRVHLHDRGITPEIDSELAMDLRLSDLGSPDQPAKFEMNMSINPMLDSMQITGEGRSAGKTLDANLHVLVRGIRLKPAAPYLAPLGIKPIGDSITLRADGKIHTGAAPGNAEGFTGSIAFDNLSATVDGKEAMALDHLRIDADTIDTKSIHLAKIDFDGARATGGRAADGNIQVLGIEYDPRLIVETAATTKPAEPTQSAPPPPPFFASLVAEPWSLGELAMRHARLDIHDQAVTPAVDLFLITDELSAKSIVHDPANPNTAVTFSGLLHAPGMTGDIKLAGTAYPFAATKKLTGSISVTGIKPDAVKPYLDKLGIESTLKNGQLKAAMETSVVLGDTITANAKVTEFDFRDGKPLLSLHGINVSDVTLNTKTGDVGIAAVELSGPGIAVLRDRTGRLASLGFRTFRPSPAKAGSEASQGAGSDANKTNSAQPSPPPFSLASLPHITLKKFTWKDIHVDFEDQTVTPPSRISLSDIGVEASDITTDVTSKTPGHFKAWLVSPQVAGRLGLDGTLSASDTKLTLTANVASTGLNATPFAPYLKSVGIEPVLKDGGITLHAIASVTTDTPAKLSLSVQNLSCTDGGTSLASVDSLIASASLHDGMIDVSRVQIDRPHTTARRDADGTLAACGFRLLAKSSSDSTTAAVPARASASIQTPSAPPATQPASPLVIVLGDLKITDADIDWTDLAVHPTVRNSAGTSLDVSNVMIGRESESPAILKLTAHATGSADNISVDGRLNTGPARQSAVLSISVSGLRAGPLASYLPPKLGCSLRSGKFSTKLEVAISKNPAGGFGANLIAGPMDFRDADDAVPLFHMDSARVIVPRIDLPDHALAVSEISVAGVQTHAEKLKNGELACMGLLLGVPSTEPEIAAAKPALPSVAPEKLAAQPASPHVPATGPSVKDLLAAAHRALPLVTVDNLDLKVAKVTLTDLSRPESQPLIISDLRLHNLNRIDWLGKDYATKPATHLQVECRVSPLIDKVLVDATVSPFARQPNLAVDFSATGVHGKGLTDLLPELKEKVDGASMENGTFTAHMESEAKLDRHSPLDFDVSHGFDLSFLLNKVKYRARPDGPLLAGVEEVRADSIHIDPSESFVHFKSIEITKPAGLLTQDEKGIHAMGLVYKPPATQPAAMEPVVAAKSQPASQPIVSANTPKPTEAPVPPTGEVRIDKLLIDGLDFSVRDTAVNPPLIIPLNGLDVEVRNISSRAPYEDLPMRFSAIVNAGKVKLAKKGSSPVVFENRDLFSQITANGEVSLYPKLHGWAKTSVSAFDLAALQGLARQYNENLTAGTYDMSVDLRFDPTGAVAVNSKFTLTDLSLSEPPNGPIAKFLHLKTPLDTAIAAVEGADGSIALPINIALDPKHISYTDLGLAMSGGISQIILTAIAAAPVKAVNGVGGIIGFGGGKKTQDLTTIIAFPAGSSVIGPSTALATLLKKLKEDPLLTVTLKHQLGAGDVKIAGTRANPTHEECVSLEMQLRSRKEALLALRGQAAGRARALLVSEGAQGADATLQQLRAIDREISATEESLDQIGDLLRPGAETQALRRTRAAALKIAADRIDELKVALQSAGVSADRIKSISPRFDPTGGLDGGEIIISVVEKK